MAENKPVVIKLRKQIIYIICGVVILSSGVIIFNLFNTVQKKKTVERTNSSYNPETSWFKKRSIQRYDTEANSLQRGGESHSATQNASSPTKAQSSQAAQVNQQDLQRQQQEAEELKAAMKAPIASNQLTPQTSNNANKAGNTNQANLPNTNNSNDGLPKDDPSMIAEKRNFLKSGLDSSNLLTTTVNNPVAKLVLAMGTKIPALLDQEINSDLPGQIYGHVSRDVFDSRTHNTLLIPAGSNLVGAYDSALAYGQERLLVAWKRVNFPNGQWLDIQGMGGADPVGAGFGDQVDNHYWRIFGATFLTSVLAAGAQLSQPQQTNALQSPGVGQTIGSSVGTQISQTGTMLMQKNINIQPTIHIRAGFEFSVEVNKDIIFPAAYTGNTNKS